VQGAEPLVLLYWPAAHAAHWPPFAPVYPLKQRHAVLSVCVVSACPELAKQCVHAAEPVSVLYCPVWQAVQEPPSGPE
jgi:hypothetical protein